MLVHSSSDYKFKNINPDMRGLYLHWGCLRLPYDLTGHTFSPGAIFVGHPLLGRLATLLNFLFSHIILSACSRANSYLRRNRQILEGWHPANKIIQYLRKHLKVQQDPDVNCQFLLLQRTWAIVLTAPWNGNASSCLILPLWYVVTLASIVFMDTTIKA